MLTPTECDYMIERDKGCQNIRCDDCFYNQKYKCVLVNSNNTHPDDVYEKYKQITLEKIKKMKEILNKKGRRC